MNLTDIITKTQKEELERMKESYPLKYTGEHCPKCGRLRVEKWTSGYRICEKCNYNLDKDKYEKSYI